MNTYSDFSFNLASAFLQNHVKKSACISPVSLLMPLAAVASAAAGDTRAEFAKVLGGPVSDPQQLLREIHEICNVLNDCPAVRELTNTIEGDKKHAFQSVFMENMHRTFGEKTGIQSGETDNIKLTNVTHFKDGWIKRFSEQEERFYTTPHGVEQHGEKVPFLHYNDEKLAYTKNDRYQSVTVPFKTNATQSSGLFPLAAEKQSGSACYMTFAMPFHRSIDDVLASPAELAEMLQCQSFVFNSRAELHLPAFSLEQDNSLNAELMQLGLNRAFNKNVSDIPAMVALQGDERLYIENVQQNIKVDVNAQGAEARAETTISMGICVGCMPLKPRKELLRFNHPFLFAIWLQTPNGDTLPLFIGVKR